MKKNQHQSVDIFGGPTPKYHEMFPADSRSDIEFRLSRILALASRRWGYLVENRLLAKTGQSRARWQTLFVLSIAPPPITTSTLSQRLAIQWPPLIRTLNALEKEGFIRRIENPDDKRSRFIEITPAGLDIVQLVQPALTEVRESVFADLNDEEMRVATQVLGKLLAGVARSQEQ